jgi:enoyl-CoA hydratase
VQPVTVSAMRIDHHDGVEILRLEEGKGNAIGPPFLDALATTLDALAAAPLVVIGQARCFSAGLALPDLIDLDRAAMGAFITRYEALMRRIFERPTPVVAAVNGHAIAGGCVLALQADVRIAAAGSARIGLNETALGIGLPAAVFETLRCQVPASSLLPVALEGRLFDPLEACALGLVDEVVEAAELEARAVERARQLGAIAPLAFAQVKAAIRRPACEVMARHSASETERWLDTWFSAAGRARLTAAVARLAGH